MFFGCPDAAGTSSAVGQSSSNSSKVWTGSITLGDGYYNLTIEYSSGGSNGALVLRAGNTAAQAQVSVYACALDGIFVQNRVLMQV